MKIEIVLLLACICYGQSQEITFTNEMPQHMRVSKLGHPQDLHEKSLNDFYENVLPSIMRKREDVNDHGLRLSLSNNIDVLREKLFNVIGTGQDGQEKQSYSPPITAAIAPAATQLQGRKAFLMNLARAKAKINKLERENGMPLFLIRGSRENWRKRVKLLE